MSITVATEKQFGSDIGSFERQNDIDPVRKFCIAFNNACDVDGVLHVLRNGSKHRGITFKVCFLSLDRH